MNFIFETGPIRPPSEANSLLLRLTRNCPWNKCAFCPVYKSAKFSKRSVDDVKNDIDSMYAIAERLLNSSNSLGLKGSMSMDVIQKAVGLDVTPEQFYHQIAIWLHNGGRTAFLQDANSLIMKTSDLVEIIKYLKEKFPSIERITSYARSKTVSKKSPDELKNLREAGLTRIHIGMESGSDRVLDMIDKGVTAEEHIIAGRNAVKAGFDVSEYYMPGLGGKEFLEENAIESARVINSINPTFIRIRSTIPVPGTGLHTLMVERKWFQCTEEEKVKELRLFIEKLEKIESTMISDHVMNLLEDVEGKFPDDKDKMLNICDKFLNMEKEEREKFIIGRRLGHFRYLSDYHKNPKVEEIRKELLRRYASIDDAIMDILMNYVHL
jgi:radical SAM superfamily enzyme YgiQ (UPF0313 family)